MEIELTIWKKRIRELKIRNLEMIQVEEERELTS